MDNPFRHRIVSDPFSGPETTVTDIHLDAFLQCMHLIDVVRRENRSASMLIAGAPGSGKTHLLHRIHQALIQSLHPHAFIAVRLHTSSKRFWRHLRTSCIDSLQRASDSSRSQLERLFLRRIWLKAGQKSVGFRQFQQITDMIRLESDLSGSFVKALTHLVRGVDRVNVLAWMKGHSLEEERLEALGLDNPSDDESSAEDQARAFLKELFRMIGPGVPVVLCFDQVEALQRHEGDKEGLFTFGQAVRTLYNECRNLVLLSCIQILFYGHLKEAVCDPDFDGLTEHQTSLTAIQLDQAVQLVHLRLESSNEGMELEEQLIAGLKEKWPSSRQTARDALTIAAELYDGIRTGKKTGGPRPQTSPSNSDADFLQGEFEQRLENIRRSIHPDDLDAVLHSAIPVICPLYDGSCSETDAPPLPDIDMMLRHKNRSIPISFCNQANLTTLAARLRRLLGLMDNQRLQELVLIRHPRRTSPKGQSKASTYLNALRRKGAKWIVPSEEAVAALAALRDVLADAQSGDLSNGGTPIGPKTVRKWIQMTCDTEVSSLLNDILQPVGTNAPFSPEMEAAIREILQETRVLYISELADRLKMDAGQLEAGIRMKPGWVGFMEGPPPLLFDPVVTVNG